VTLHPFDIQQQADALYAALTMDRDLRRARREAAALVVRENDLGKWLVAQLADLPIHSEKVRRPESRPRHDRTTLPPQR
jgi:trehalose-6-phosphate synthase